MTLIVGMSKAEGIYMSTDYRVTDARTGKLIDDSSVKFLSVRYPPDDGGPTALFAYTGLAILPDGTPTGTWMRETLRGESELFVTSMAHLQARLDRDIAHLGHALIINVLAVEGQRRYGGALSNLRMVQKKLRLMDAFDFQMNELIDPFVFVNGSGSARALPISTWTSSRLSFSCALGDHSIT